MVPDPDIHRAGALDVVFVVRDGIQALDLTGPWEVFHGANALLARWSAQRPRYRLTLCSTDGRVIETESGRATWHPRLIDAEPGADHRNRVLAAKVALSERHFIRGLSDQIGLSPAQYVARVRVEAARRSLESTDLTIQAIADRCGFGTAETLRRTFSRRLGVPPDHYRQHLRTGAITERPADPTLK